MREQLIAHRESTRLFDRVLEVIETEEVDEKVVVARRVIAKEPEHLVNMLRWCDQHGHVAKRACEEAHIGERLLHKVKRWMIESRCGHWD